MAKRPNPNNQLDRGWKNFERTLNGVQNAGRIERPDALALRSEVRAVTPVITGRLRRGMRVQIRQERNNQRALVVQNPWEYAPKVERRRKMVERGMEAWLARWRLGYGSRVRARKGKLRR